VHSPVNLKIFDEAGNLLDVGKNFTYMHGNESFIEGQFIILPEKFHKFTVELHGFSSGNFTLCIYSNGKINVFSKEISKGQTVKYDVDLSSGEINVRSIKVAPAFSFELLYIPVISSVIAIITFLTLRHKKRKIQK